LVLGLALVVAPIVPELRQFFADPFDAPRSVSVVTTDAPEGTTTVSSDTEASRSFLERALGTGGLFFIRLGAVALAAFAAGAVVQRALLADFALKLGPVEVPALKETASVSEQALSEIEAQLTLQANAVEAAMEVAADSADGVAALTEQMESLRKALTPLLGLAAGHATSDIATGESEEVQSDDEGS
jgi:hypothetical protein